MSDLETKKYSQEDPLPLLSLKTRSDETRANAADEKEQEDLWTRSLEYFENMKKASNARF